MIVRDALPGIKRFLKPARLTQRSFGLVVRFVAAFGLHFGRMSAAQAAHAVRSEPRHRAQLGRFLARHSLRDRQLLATAHAQVLALESTHGRFVFLIDQTLCSQQGETTENTYSTGNRKRRPRRGVRHSTYTHTRKRCHCFVMGLLLTPGGLRIPFRRSYYTKDYCQAKGWAYRTQTELAAEMIDALPVPGAARVVVLGDTAFDAGVIHHACERRQYSWVVPMNPERVLAGPKPRSRVRSLGEGLSAGQFQAIRLYPHKGEFVALRRLSAYRIGPKVKPRVYYTHSEDRDVHSVGNVRLVFSTREKPEATGVPPVQKILMTNDRRLRASEVVELYALRWQIELFFKELKSTLGFDQYRFRRFEAVEGWVELALVTFVYLEWHRACQLRRKGLSEEQRKRWRTQRTHGLCVAVRRQVERSDLEAIAEALKTKGGVRRLRRLLDNATQAEYRTAI